MIRIACVLALLVIIPSAAWALFGHGRTIQTVGTVHATAHPISIAPTSSTIIDTAPPGTPIATLSIGTSDGSAFTGSLSVTEGTGIVCGTSPCSVTTNLVSARQLSVNDEGMHTLQIAATENGQTFTQAFTLNVFGLNLTVNPASPSIPSTTSTGANVATMTASWTNGATFTGTEIFAAPNYDGGSTYSISASNIIVSTTGPGVSGAGGTTQNVSVQAVQMPVSVDGTVSNAPNGPPLANSTGVWFWDGADSGRPNESFVYASNAGSIVAGSLGIGVSMEVANGGQLYINTESQGWFVWNGTTFVASSNPSTAFAGPAGACATGGTGTVTVAPGTVCQTMDGFGAMGYNANTTVAGQLWGTSGLGYSIMRYPTPYYGLNSNPCSSVSSACITGGNATMSYAQNVISAAGSDLRTLWTVGHFPAVLGTAGRDCPIDPAVIPAAGTFLANFLDSLRIYFSIVPSALGVQNEPDDNFTCGSTLMTATQIHDLINNIGPALASRSITVPLLMPETFLTTDLGSWLQPTMTDPAVAAYVSFEASHQYDGDPTVQVVNPYISNGKRLWETETSTGNGFGPNNSACNGCWDPSITDGMVWAGILDRWLAGANGSAWIWWQPAGCGNPPVDNECLESDDDVTISKRGYIIGNYSKFVRPGWVMIAADHAPQGGVTVTAYKNPANSSFAIVAQNSGSGAVSQAFSLNGQTTASVTPWITSGSLNLAQQSAVSVGGSSFSYTLPATSVTTFVGTFGTASAAVIPSYNDASANWKHAGLLDLGGIPNRTTACATVNPTGITPPASGDDAATINAAINACADGNVLPLGAGTFQIAQSEHIWINGNITLRGSGSPTNNCSTGATTPCWPTVINVYDGAIANWTISATTGGTHCGVDVAHAATCTAASGVILMSHSDNFNWGWAGCNLGSSPTGCGTTLTADAAAGATSVTVASTTGLSVGSWVLIDEDPQVVSTTNPTGGAAVNASSDWLIGSGSPVTMKLEGGDIPNGFSFNPNRVNAELHLITGISGNTVTFDDPLTMAFRQSGSHNAQLYYPTIQSATTANPFLDQAGVENLSITRPGNGGIQVQFCSHCWVKNVEVGGWIAGAVNLIYAARTQLEGNYFHDCFDCENNGAEYPVGISNASTESYVDNNIIVRGGKGMVGRAAGANVVAYNYVDDTFYMQAVIGDYWEDMGVNGSHYAGTHSWLFEGNWGSNCDNDETHGNNIYHVYFRNYCTGLRATFTDPSIPATVNDAAGIAYQTPKAGCASPCANPPGFLRTAGPMAFNYWHAYVGNILGTPGQTTAANGWIYRCYPPSSSQINKCIWGSGWVGSEWPAADPNLDGTSNTWLFRHGNYDYVNGAIADWQAGYSRTLPNSLYLSAAPAFFTAQSCTWPWIDSPSVTISKLPAQRRFSAGTPFVPVSGC